MKNILKVSFVIIGTMIGAGFASGQEIELFFNQYGTIGILGIILSCTFTGVIIYRVLKLAEEKQIKNYKEFLEIITPNKKLNQIIQIIINLFLLLSFYIMVAGFCAYFKQELQIPIWISAIVMAFLCYLTFKSAIQGVISANTFLIPFLIIFILYLGIKNIPFLSEYFSQGSNIIMPSSPFSWLISSILYASYNSILLVPILIELREQTSTKSSVLKVSVFCTIVFSILGICLIGLLLRGTGYIHEIEMPIVEIVKQFGSSYPWIYGVVNIVAIFTSAIAAGYGFLKNVSKTNQNYQKKVILLCISSIFIAPIGFANLVNFLYPIFGILGLLQVLQIFRK